MNNPTRRNRNIGTAKQGHGADNKLTIPYPCSLGKSFHERLRTYQKTERTINGHNFIFVIEALRESCIHACTISDLEKIIKSIPTSDYGKLKFIILRQPKKKERILSPVWGRLIYSYEFEGEYHPAVILEAVDLNEKIKWPKSLDPESQKEFERLKKDGHTFSEIKNRFIAPITVSATRNTQLYRTLLHEFGHYVHYLESVERQGNDDEAFEDWSVRNDFYQKINNDVKEKYAHRYADTLLKTMQAKQIVPFDQITD